MNENAMNILLEKLANIENRQHALEVEFIDYAEKNPKGNDQWTEQRLRALEEIIKRPPMSTPGKNWDAEILAAMSGEDSLDTRVNNLEVAFAQHKQVHDADLKRVGSELRTLFKYTNDDRVKLEAESDHHDWHESRVDAIERKVESITYPDFYKTLVEDLGIKLEEKLREFESRLSRFEAVSAAFPNTEIKSFKAWAEDNIKKLQERDTQARIMIVDLLKDVLEIKQRVADLELRNDR
jgi:hypothetical protein